MSHRNVRRHTLKYKYGLTPEQVQLLWEQQNRRCAICFCPVALLGQQTHIDHDHATEVVRGLLCVNCNMGLGHFRDDPLILRQAWCYLEKFR